MRSFLAFDFSLEDKKKIKEILRELLRRENFSKLKRKGVLKIVNEKNYHVTFLFFENLNKELKKEIENLMFNLEFEEFEVSIKKVNYFKNSKGEIRVIFLELGNEIFNILEKYKKEFSKLKLDFERKRQLNNLKPHITLIRLRNPIKEYVLKEDIEKINNLLSKMKLKIKISSFVLFKSTLFPTGPIYEKIFEIK